MDEQQFIVRDSVVEMERLRVLLIGALRAQTPKQQLDVIGELLYLLQCTQPQEQQEIINQIKEALQR